MYGQGSTACLPFAPAPPHYQKQKPAALHTLRNWQKVLHICTIATHKTAVLISYIALPPTLVGTAATSHTQSDWWQAAPCMCT